jgi:hypothetical protein
MAILVPVTYSDGARTLVLSPGPTDPTGVLAADVCKGLVTLGIPGKARTATGAKMLAGGEHSVTRPIE